MLRAFEMKDFSSRTTKVVTGFTANLVLVDGDPLSDVGLVENPDAVMISRRWIFEKKLAQGRNASINSAHGSPRNCDVSGVVGRFNPRRWIALGILLRKSASKSTGSLGRRKPNGTLYRQGRTA